MSRDLTEEQERNVRTALLHLRLRYGRWDVVAKALRTEYDTVEKVANGRGRGVSARMVFRVADVLGCSIDGLLAGEVLPHACPNCGYMPESDPSGEVIDGPWKSGE